MTGSERFKKIMNGEKVDRLPILEWAPWWGETLKRWEGEGLSFRKYNDWRDGYVLQRQMGLDGCMQTIYNVRTATTPRAKSHGAGIIQSAEDYQKIKPTLYPDIATLYDDSRYAALDEMRADGDTIHFFTVEGFFWFARELFGIEPHLYSFYDEPELLHQMCDDYATWLETALNDICDRYTFDFMSFAEDMSYNNGPMLGKDLFDEFLAPYYRRVIPILKKRGIPVFIDSDGDITKAVDWYAEVGADGMFPLERQAGVDVSLYIEKHPEMAFLGHYDKMCMKFGEEAMRAEFERLLPSAKKGKLFIGVDHQTPPDVSVENYKIFVKLFKEYAAKINE